MKKRVLAFFMALGAIGYLGLVSAYAYVDTSIKATIPFDFTVEKSLLPAGQYEIRAVLAGRGDMLVIRNIDTNQSVVIPNVSNIEGKDVEQAKLLFDHIGDNYFLSQVWEGFNVSGNQLPMSPAERKLIKQNGGYEEVSRIVIKATINKS